METNKITPVKFVFIFDTNRDYIRFRRLLDFSYTIESIKPGFVRVSSLNKNIVIDCFLDCMDYKDFIIDRLCKMSNVDSIYMGIADRYGQYVSITKVIYKIYLSFDNFAKRINEVYSLLRESSKSVYISSSYDNSHWLSERFKCYNELITNPNYKQAYVSGKYIEEGLKKGIEEMPPKTMKFNNTTIIVKDSLPEIKNVIYNGPATIVFWNDGTKTVVKHDPKDKKDIYSKEKGLAMAISKKALGNDNKWYNTFKKFNATN